MIWFNPEKDGGFNLGTPDWSGSSAKVNDSEKISDIVIGQAFSKPPKTTPQMQAPEEAERETPPPPEPQVDPRVENTLKLLAASMSELATKKKQYEQRDLNFCIEMAFAIAEELVAGAIDAQPEKVLDIVKESLGMLEETDNPVIRLHPDIIEALEEHELFENIQNQENLTIKSDPEVSKMGCLVTAKRKIVDGQVTARMNRIRTLFNEEQGNAQ